MARRGKGPRLSLYKAKGRTTLWTIRDGQRTIGTGCLEGEREEAERRFGEYIAQKHDPRASQRGSDPNAVSVADALNRADRDRQRLLRRVGQHHPRGLQAPPAGQLQRGAGIVQTFWHDVNAARTRHRYATETPGIRGHKRERDGAKS
jgi:hypothetical protein